MLPEVTIDTPLEASMTVDTLRPNITEDAGHTAETSEGFMVKDRFTDANDLALTSHTPDTDVTGDGWQTGGGSFVITDNRLRCSGGSGAEPLLANRTINAGVANSILYCRMRCAFQSGQTVGLQARVSQAAKTGWAAVLSNSAGMLVELDGFSRVTREITADFHTDDVEEQYELTCSGTTITFENKDLGTLVARTGATRNSAVTAYGVEKVGIGVVNDSWDDFKVESTI